VVNINDIAAGRLSFSTVYINLWHKWLHWQNFYT